MDFLEGIGRIVEVGGDRRSRLPDALLRPVAERVVLVGFLLRGSAVGNLGQALEFVVAVGQTERRTANGFRVGTAVADAIVGLGIGGECRPGLGVAARQTRVGEDSG